ncbi:V-type ATP synthase subunit I [Treponema sp. OttesenSCG-928-L16]|nr:V-type ATP synthase subunit I [Treponema sp. OttesenSCG-928-L16]
MIVPMKKVSLVVMEKTREASLEKLREVGVVHLERKSVSSDALASLLDKKNKAESALGILRPYPDEGGKTDFGPDTAVKAPENAEADGIYTTDALNYMPEPGLVNQVLALADERKNLQEQQISDTKERNRLEKWGNFDPAALRGLEEAGLSLIPYELPRKSYEALGDEQKVIVLGQDKALVYCAAVGEAIPGEIPLALPDRSLERIGRDMAERMDELDSIEKQLASLASLKGRIQAELNTLFQDIEFESARVGMETVEDAPAEFTVSWITGFVPQDEAGKLKRAASENGWALLIDDPEEDDNPPTLIKNNKFVSLIQPLFNLLGTIPGYREYDISLSYLLFFCFFFAMIFGDAGYGALLLIISVFLGLRSKKKSGGIPDVAILLGLLSASTLVWGSITGSWFAIPMDSLPGFLKALIIPPFRPNPELDPKLAANLVQQNVKHLCFIVGAGQIVLAHLKNIKKEFPSLTFLAQVGWLSMVVGLYFLVLNLVLDATQFPIPSFALVLIGGGILMYFIFAEQRGGNFLKNVGKSFANFLPTFLDAVSSFSDIISYIRLFAVGLAGAAIAGAFNDMALGLPAGPVRIIAGGIILIAGHSLNLAMNALSVVVHGVRLNLLEYAGHLGMEWSGHKYAPFALKDTAQEKSTTPP